MNKKIIFILSLLLIAVFTIVFSLVNKSNLNKNLIKYIKSLGYEQEESGLYYKQISDTDLNNFYENQDVMDVSFDGLYFNIDTYEFIENKFDSIEDSKLYFMGIYDYKTHSLNYTYRLTYENSNAIYEGNYDRKSKKLTCENIYAHDTGIKENDEEVCQFIQYNVDDFIMNIDSFITKAQFLEYMEDAKIDD